MKFLNIVLLGLLLSTFLVFLLPGIAAAPSLTNNIYDDTENNILRVNNNASYDLQGFYDFNDTNEYLSGSIVRVLGTTSNYSFSLFIYSRNNTYGVTHPLIGSTINTKKGSFRLNALQGLWFRYFNESGTAQTIQGTNNEIGMNTWSHVVVTVMQQGSNANVTFYINGTLTKSQLGVGLDNKTDLDLLVGGDGSIVFNGSIDEVRIYNKTLNTTEVSQIYTQGRAKNTSLLSTSLLNFYSFSDAGYIEAAGTGDLNISYIFDNYAPSGKINNTGTSNYTFYADINLLSTSVNFSITNKDVSTLRLYSLADNHADILSSNNGKVNITGVTIVSWNGTDVDTNILDERSSLFFTNGPVYLTNANLSYLGYNESTEKRQGLSFRFANGSIIRDSFFDHMLYAAEARSSDNTQFTNNTLTNINGMIGFNAIFGGNYTMVYNTVRNIFNAQQWSTAQESVALHTYQTDILVNISDNFISGCEIGIDTYYNSTQSYFFNNTIENCTYDGIRLESGTMNSVIKNNFISATGANTTKSGSAIHIFGNSSDPISRNVTIEGNVISDGYKGIVIIRAEDITLNNNFYANHTSQTGTILPISLNTVSRAYLRNNTISNTRDLAFRLQGVTNVTINDTTLRNSSLDFNFYGENASNVEIRNVYTDSNNSFVRIEQAAIITNFTLINYSAQQFILRNTSNFDINISPGYAFLQNKNTTYTANISLYADNGALIYYTNETLICANISVCAGQFSYTLTGTLSTYLFSNFNITQGVSRYGSPGNISNISTNLKEITWSLNSTVSNLFIAVATGGIVPSNPRLTFPNGSFEYPAYSFDGSFLTMNVTLPPGTSTLTLDTTSTVEYQGAACVPGVVSIIYSLSVIIVVLGLLAGLYFSKNLDPMSVLTTFIMTMVFVVMVVQPC